MRLVSCLAGACLALSTLTATATTLPSEVVPGFDAESLMDPGGQRPNDFGLNDPAIREALNAARRNFDEALDILERDLEREANYASILALASDLRAYGGPTPRLLWLHALALAATGSLDEAQAALTEAAPAAADSTSPLPLVAEAMLRLRQGDPDTATALLRAALERAPEHAYAHNLLGIAEADRGDLAASRASFAEAARFSPEAMIYWRNLGVSEFALDRMDAALDALDRALAIEPDDCPALIAKAQIFEASQRPEGAANLVGRCLAAQPDEARAVGYLVSLQVAQGAYELALETVSRFEGLLPTPDLLRSELHLIMDRPAEALGFAEQAGEGPAAAFRMALAHAMAGDIDRVHDVLSDASVNGAITDPRVAMANVALAVARGTTIAPAAIDALAGDPAPAAALAWFRALALASSDSPAAAAAAARDATGLLPGVSFEGVPAGDWEALADPDLRAEAALGMFWLLGEYDLAAARTFAAALERAPVEQLRYFAAISDIRLGARDRALERLSFTNGAAPGFYSAQVLLGELQMARGMLPEALASYQRAVAVVEDPGALMRIGLLADHLDNVAVAEDALRRYIALFPDAFIGYNQLAWLFIQRETRLDEAEALAQTANRLQPDNASVLDNLGWIRFLRGDAEGARDLLREANRRSGESNPDILYHLAVVEAETGETERSRELLARLDAVTPPGHPVLERVEQLRTQLR
jgi:tetratricopeptide (TPR) repeat protein